MPTPKNPFHRRSAAIERLGQTAVAIQRLWIRPSRFVIPPFQFVTLPSHFVTPPSHFVIPASHLVIPASHFVIPALSRDPSHAAVLCKGQRCPLDPGSSPGMTKVSWMFHLHRAGSMVWVWLALLLVGWSGGVGAEPKPTPQVLQPLPWVQAVLAQPEQAPILAREALHSARLSAQDPLLAWQTLAGWTLGPQTPVLGKPVVHGADPLPGALLRLARASGSGLMVAPSRRELPEPLRSAWAQQIEAVVVARHALDEALAGLDTERLRLDDSLRAVLLRQALRGDFREGDPVDVRHWLGRINQSALARGMAVLLQAADHLQRTLALRAWPALVWQHRTPWGLVRLDTTRQSGRHLVQDPLLWVSLGGDDHYRFRPRSGQNPVSVFMDLRGNDTYISEHEGADPSVGFLGLGLLWDGDGRNQHSGTWLAQGAALMGAGVLVDASRAGAAGSQMEATGHAQAFALDGLALLMAGGGDDAMAALTHAQGSAGPLGAAWLINVAGNDRYVLGNERLVQASSQLPERNASMGQGAGRGWRGRDGAADTPGGVGLLVDLAGDDHYTAQVFAQGVGFQQGMGVLVDAGGNNHHTAAWYALGAAAHQAVGVFWASGTGSDVYQVSHSSALGAATDRSVGWFEKSKGCFTASVGDFSKGASQLQSTARHVTQGLPGCGQLR